jgi:hypothetical protein
MLCVFAVLVLILPAWGGSQPLALERGLGHRPATPEEQAYVDAVYTEVTRVEANDLARARLQAEGGPALLRAEGPAALPTSVDNSLLQYFPPIGNQGVQGSCTAWASCYYWNTYTQAVDAGLDVSTWDPDHTLSPGFMYPLVNYGVDGGAFTQYVVARLSEIGCSSWSLKPYVVSDWTSWPSEAAWVEALEYRTDTPYVIDGSTPAGLDAIKQHLANGNLCVTDFDVYNTWWVYYPDDSKTGIDNDVYYYPDGSYEGGHAVTIVGYDDTKSYVDHRDAITYYGAFLMANSWGPGWGVGNSTGGGPGDYGYFWVAYNMFLELPPTFGPLAYYNDDRPDYQPRLYAVAGINHDQRGYVYLDSSITHCPTPTCWNSHAVLWYDGGTALAVTDADRIAIDMTDGVPIAPGRLHPLVWLWLHADATTDATITSTDFYHDLDGDGAYAITSSTDPTVTITPETWGYAEAILPSPLPQVLLEVHPNERGPGPTAVTRFPGLDYWTWPTLASGSAYTWKQYDFDGSANLWVQVCAQNFSAFQNSQNGSLAQEDLLKLILDGVVLSDFWGIQSGAPGSYQWKGSAETGNRVTLEFLALGLTPGLHQLVLQAKMSPVIYWIKVHDFEARYEPEQ